MRSRSTAAAEEIERLATALEEAQERAEAAAGGVRDRRAGASEADRGTTPTWTQRHAEAVAGGRGGRGRLKELTDAERAAESDAAQWKAREEALALGLRRKDGAGALLARRPSGCPACSAAWPRCSPSSPATRRRSPPRLGVLADAVAVSDVDDARAADRAAQDRGRRPGGAARRRRPACPRRATGRRCPRAPAGRSTWCVRPNHLRPALVRALHDVVLVARPGRRAHAGRSAARAARGDPGRRRARRLHRRPAARPRQQSYIEIQAAVDEARARRAEADSRVGRARARSSPGAGRAGACARRRSTAAATRARRPTRGPQRRRPPLAELGAAASPRAPRPRRPLAAAPARPSRPATATWPASPISRNGCGWPRPPRLEADPST